ncbi:hypothetical protein JCM6882_001947 [Rhodosporidiobolus microsporus]
MANKDAATPVVEPIQKGSANPPSSSSSNPIHPSPVVDEGPADSNIPPSQSFTAARPGTQDALRGQGNSATKTGISREDVAPVVSEQKKDEKEYDAEGQKGVETAGGHEDFKQTSVKGGEPAPGKPHSDGRAGDNLVEAGTTMAGDASASGGSKSGKKKPALPPGTAKL